MAKKHMKRCSTSLIIGEMLITTTMRLPPHTGQNSHHQKKKKKSTNKCWRGCGAKGLLLHCWWDVNWYGKQYEDPFTNLK